VGASTKAKNIRPPIQATSERSIKKRRKDMAENYSLAEGEKDSTTEITELHRGRLTTDH
jgi:hypothetical protein